MTEDHREVVRREFVKQVARFGEPGHTLSSPVYLEWVVNNLENELMFLQTWVIVVGAKR